MSKEGFVNIHGKEYKTVAKRVQEFRAAYPTWSIMTDVVKIDDDQVLIKAQIINAESKIVATGHGHELKSNGQINRTSYVENAETSAIGRALACLGLGGTEFASADEVANAIYQQNMAKVCDVKKPENITPNAGALSGFSKDEIDLLHSMADEFTMFVSDDNMELAKEMWSSLDNQQKAALWSLLNSKVRSKFKGAK